VQAKSKPKAMSKSALPLILVAEDNEVNAESMCDYLFNRGFRVVLSKNGLEALELAQAEKPDIVLMDIQMPIMDGLEATQRIRANADLAEVPIIALTALAMQGDRERCLSAGANLYVMKPVRLKELVESIHRLLDDS
jgi:CheY-like chemotaxis protein